MKFDARQPDARQFYRRLYLGFPSGERINKVSVASEATFWRLLVVADDFGNLSASPRYLLGVAFPLRPEISESDLKANLDELRHVGLIAPYEAEGSQFLHITGFLETQSAISRNGVRVRRFPEWPGETQCKAITPSATQDFPKKPKQSTALLEPPPPPPPPPNPEPETEPPPGPKPPGGGVVNSLGRVGGVVNGGGGSGTTPIARRFAMLRMMGFGVDDANDFASRVSEAEIEEATRAVAKRKAERDRGPLRDKTGYARAVFERMLKCRAS